MFLLILLSFAKFLLFFSHSVVFNGVIIRSILSKCLGLFWSEWLTGFQSPLKFNECQATWKKHVNFLHRATQYFRFIGKVTVWIFAKVKRSSFHESSYWKKLIPTVITVLFRCSYTCNNFNACLYCKLVSAGNSL